MNVSTGIAITSFSLTDEFCSDESGSIDISVSGGVGPYSFLWSPGGETTEDINDLTAGSYSVTAVDDNDGCSLTMDFDIINTINFTADGIVTNSSCLTCTTGAIDISLNELITDSPYTFLWSPGGETTEDLSSLIPGSYSVTVTGASGCTFDTTFVVGNNDDVGFAEKPEWNLNVYPNPTRDNLNIVYDFLNESKVVMSMSNVLGAEVYYRVIEDKNGTLKLNIEEFRAGVYFIQFSSEEQSRTVKLTITE